MGERTTDGEQATGEAVAKDRLWTPLFVVLILATLTAFMVGQGLNAGTSVYVSVKGGSETLSGVLAAAFSVMSAFARIFFGRIIDRSGRFKVMMIGIVILSMGTFLPVVRWSLALLVVGRILQGAGFAAATTALSTAAADILPRTRLGEGLGYHGLGQAVAFTIGPALGVWLAGTSPAENMFLGLGFLSVVGAVLILFCRYENHLERLPENATYRLNREAVIRGNDSIPARVRHGEPVPAGDPTREPGAGVGSPMGSGKRKTGGTLSRLVEKRALPGALTILFMAPAFAFVVFYIGLYGAYLGIPNPGVFYSLSAITMIGVRLFSSTFMDRMAPEKVVLIPVSAGILCFILLLSCGKLAGDALHAAFFGAGLLYGLCMGVGMPINQAMAVKNTPPDRWGAANALYFLAIDLGMGVAGLGWGIVNDLLGFTASMVLVICLLVASYLIALRVYGR